MQAWKQEQERAKSKKLRFMLTRFSFFFKFYQRIDHSWSQFFIYFYLNNTFNYSNIFFKKNNMKVYYKARDPIFRLR